MAILYPYWDNALGKWISGPSQRKKVMKARGVHEASDDPKLRELRKMGAYYRGKQGNKPIDKVGKNEMMKTYKDYIVKDREKRIDKSMEKSRMTKEKFMRRVYGK